MKGAEGEVISAPEKSLGEGLEGRCVATGRPGARGDILRHYHPAPAVKEVCVELSDLFSFPETCPAQLAVVLLILQQTVSEFVV